ncbi:hypothetical protein ISG33_11110 [Glaciecola sp. MH2013]|uniref:RHS repeat-associated core domain-containing protein n=1 Tax=Glaciecola sp. MH2013 TaxID=2785524 RepID=UPI00189E22D4|nr:RHS repeat-associated core domain-containing protein [Glaciecola sp. MH2013]MBF7073948.1 hypothetical protein [Glaciecola sp. MH2013]
MVIHVDTDNSYLYTGEQYDAQLDNYYLRASYYNQGVGRFTQMGEFGGWENNPISLNKYLYGHSDPINHIDPSGYLSLRELGISIKIRSIQATQTAARVGNSVTRTLSNFGRQTVSTGKTSVIGIQYMSRVS